MTLTKKEEHFLKVTLRGLTGVSKVGEVMGPDEVKQ